MSAQFDYVAAREAVYESRLAIYTRGVLIQIIEHMPNCRPGLERLSRRAGVSRRQALREIDALESSSIISVTRLHGLGNVYALVDGWEVRIGKCTAGTSDSQSPVPTSHDHQCPPVTGVVPTSHPKQEEKQESKQEDPASKSQRGKVARSSSSKAKPKKPKTESQPVAGAHELKVHYVAEFLATRGVEPEFGKRWSRAMKSLGELVTTHGLDKAKSICSTALRDEFARRRINPWEILEDSNKYLGKRPGCARTRPPVQQGLEPGIQFGAL